MKRRRVNVEDIFQFEPAEAFRQRMMDKLRARGTTPNEQKVLRFHLHKLNTDPDCLKHMIEQPDKPDLCLKLNHRDLTGKIQELEVHLP